MKTKLLLLIVLSTLSLNLFAVDYKVYDFQELSEQLGYPDKTFFGSSDYELIDLETYISKEDTYYKEINGYLRNFPNEYSWYGLGPERAKGIVDSMDKIFERVPVIPEELILFRGVDLKYRKNVSFAIGEEVLEKGFLSTSTSFDAAYEFTKDPGKNPSRSPKAIFVLYQNSKDIKGILIDEEEDEVILKHGQKLKFMSTKNLNPYFETYLVQICKITCEEQMNEDIKKFWANYPKKTWPFTL
jgi:hypothetical protein